VYVLVAAAAQDDQVLGLVALGDAPRDDMVNVKLVVRAAKAAMGIGQKDTLHRGCVALGHFVSRISNRTPGIT
jgi:hypothetical protein